MRIGFATMDWALGARDAKGRPTIGGSGWYRCLQPARALASRGHEVAVGTLVARRGGPGELGVRTWDELVYWGCDVIVLQRWMHEVIEADMLKARATGQVLVNDVDDWWEGLASTNAAFKSTHPRTNAAVNRNHYRRVIAASDVVTVSTPFLRDHYGGEMIRNRVDCSRFARNPVRDRRPRVVWVGAMPWRSGDVEILRGLAGQLDVDWVHGGSVEPGEFAKAAGLDPARVDERPMTDVVDYPGLFRDADVGVVPLSDRPFNHAKSWIKGLEYAAAGLPFVATATPEYLELERLGCGVTARRPRDWLRHLRRLADPAEREAQREGNLAVALEQGPSLQGEEWEALLAGRVAEPAAT